MLISYLDHVNIVYSLKGKMADNCGTETMLAKVIGPCAGWEREEGVIAYKTLESYLLMKKSRERCDALDAEKSYQGFCILLGKRYFIGLHIIKAAARLCTQNSNLRGS